MENTVYDLDGFISALWNSPDKEVSNAARRIAATRGIPMPFGKYTGTRFEKIPLKYLDETVSVMPPTWLVRQARDFVSACMVFVDGYSNLGGGSVPAVSVVEALNQGE